MTRTERILYALGLLIILALAIWSIHNGDYLAA
jgi:hypothetical protein